MGTHSDAADGSSGEDSGAAVVDINPWRERRADALMDLVRTGLAHAQDGHAVGADRYMVHAVADINALSSGKGRRPELLGRGVLDEGTLAKVDCDTSVVTYVVDGDEPLQLGRKTRVWNQAQRRAITVRDGGRCRYAGCRYTMTDIHHIDGGVSRGRPTSLTAH